MQSTEQWAWKKHHSKLLLKPRPLQSKLWDTINFFSQWYQTFYHTKQANSLLLYLNALLGEFKSSDVIACPHHKFKKKKNKNLTLHSVSPSVTGALFEDRSKTEEVSASPKPIPPAICEQWLGRTQHATLGRHQPVRIPHGRSSSCCSLLKLGENCGTQKPAADGWNHCSFIPATYIQSYRLSSPRAP